METIGFSAIEAGSTNKRYALKEALEVFPLDSSSVEPQYVIKTPDGRSYMVSERLKNILLLFDGKRTLGELAEIVSRQQESPVSGVQMDQILATYISRYGLVEEVKAEPASSTPEPSEFAVDKVDQERKRSFDFVFRLPLIPASVAAPIADRLTWLFKPATAALAVAAIVLAHLAFYQNWFAPRPRISFGTSDFLIFYVLGLSTALFHELGHASACRAFRCEHGPIGFLLYIILPAFYVNLSNAWRLPGRQRAVIDVGGIYFQLMTVIPLLLLFSLTGRSYFCGVIYAVDWMVLFSLNPLFKFDGYWLLVDLTGIINLQKRGWRVVKEIILSSLGITRGVPALNEVAGAPRKLLLVMYSFISLALFTSLFLLLLTFAPTRVTTLTGNLHQILTGSSGVGGTLVLIGRVMMNLFFFLFICRFFSKTIFRLLKRSTWRSS